MHPTPLQSGTVHDRASELTLLLAGRIADGHWPPGHHFTWPQLAAEFTLDQYLVVTVLAPALRALRTAGAIETRPCAGHRVTTDEPWPPDTISSTPHYRHIETELRQRLHSGMYRPSSVFPSALVLGEEFGVSATTVQVACRSLVSQQILIPRQGITFVCPDLTDLSPRQVLTPAGRRTAGRYERHRAFGKELTLAAWARDPRCQVSYSTLRARYVAWRWPLEKALGPLTRTRLPPTPERPRIHTNHQQPPE
ncbi:GntR family transcriptional regulator [Streptomyces sp. NPDC004539]|uniref:GntR family transcriptional regulator n=1 Tax=Streptomyces sp. NPDC004539 TaxID=3154280 RepID=UPI0033AB1580